MSVASAAAVGLGSSLLVHRIQSPETDSEFEHDRCSADRVAEGLLINSSHALTKKVHFVGEISQI